MNAILEQNGLRHQIRYSNPVDSSTSAQQACGTGTVHPYQEMKFVNSVQNLEV